MEYATLGYEPKKLPPPPFSETARKILEKVRDSARWQHVVKGIGGFLEMQILRLQSEGSFVLPFHTDVVENRNSVD